MKKSIILSIQCAALACISAPAAYATDIVGHDPDCLVFNGTVICSSETPKYRPFAASPGCSIDPGYSPESCSMIQIEPVRPMLPEELPCVEWATGQLPRRPLNIGGFQRPLW